MSKTYCYLKIDLKDFTEAEVNVIETALKGVIKTCLFDLDKPIEIKKIIYTSSQEH